MASHTYNPHGLFYDLLQRLAVEHTREVEELRSEVTRLRIHGNEFGPFVSIVQEFDLDKRSEASSDHNARTSCPSCMNQPTPMTGSNWSKSRKLVDAGVLPKLPGLPSPAPSDQPDQAALAAAYAMVSIVEEDETIINDAANVPVPESTDALGGPYPESTEQSQPQSEPLPESPQVQKGWQTDWRSPDKYHLLSVVPDQELLRMRATRPLDVPILDIQKINGRPVPVLSRWAQLVQAKLLRPEQAQILDVWDELDQISKFVTKSMPQKELTSLQAFVKDEKENIRSHGRHKRQRTRHLERHCSGQCGIMHPSSPKRVIWDMFGAFILMKDLVMIPLQVFEHSTTGLPESYQRFEQTFDFIATLFWTVDIMVSFTTGYFSDEGFIEMRPALIARHYMGTWGPLDFFIVILDWCTIAVGLGSETSGYVRLGKTVSRFVRILRLLRFMKLSNAIKGMVARVNSEYILTMGGLFRLVVLIVIFAHYLACGWYGLSQLPKGWNTWAGKFLAHEDSLSYAYATSLHWSLTQFTPASMEVVPRNPYERFYNCAVIVMALVTFSSFVSSITSAMTHLRTINSRQTEQDTLIRRFFSENKVSHEVAARVWHFLRKSKRSHTYRLKERDVPALKSLPDRIRQELRMEVFMPLLSSHPLLSIFSHLDPATLRQVCDFAVSDISLKSGEELYASGSAPKSMCFVAHGTLEYCTEDEKVLLVEGEWACEASLWAQGLKLQGYFVSVTACELVLINAEQFQSITKSRTDLSGFLAPYAKCFITLFNDASLDEHFSNVLLNDRETIGNLAFGVCDDFLLKVKVEEHSHLNTQSSSLDIASVLFKAAHHLEGGRVTKRHLQETPQSSQATSFFARQSAARQSHQSQIQSEPTATDVPPEMGLLQRPGTAASLPSTGDLEGLSAMRPSKR